MLAIGLTLSITFTVIFTPLLLLLPSVSVNNTVLAPKSEPVKKVLLKVKPVIAQLSIEPLLTMAVVKVADPEVFRYKLTILFTMAVGLMVSNTVTFAMAVRALLLASFAVMVTWFEPILAQVKLLLLKLILGVPQLSEALPVTWALVIVATHKVFR